MIKYSTLVLSAFLLGLFILGTESCTADVVATAGGCDSFNTRYESDDPNVINIKEIIDQTCAYSGCHDGAGGIGPGNYNRYDRIAQDIESGSFAARVINQRDNPALGMPPDNSVYPQSRRDSLTTLQLEVITCWLQDGFPE